MRDNAGIAYFPTETSKCNKNPSSLSSDLQTVTCIRLAVFHKGPDTDKKAF